MSWAKTFGQAVGKIHKLHITGTPENVLKVRPHWHQVGTDFIPPMELSEDEVLIHNRRTEILNRIQDLAKTPESYGLVHVDLHLGNFIVHAQSPSITVLDFDDFSFGWFVMDLVTPITDIVVCHNGTNKDEIINAYLAEAIAGLSIRE